jgi:hypothetical protein
VNLSERSVTFSEPCFIDDTNIGNLDFGALQAYEYAGSNGQASAPLAAALALETAGASIPGGIATQATPLVAAQDGSYTVRSFLRVGTDILPASATIISASVRLTTTATTATGTLVMPGFLRLGGWNDTGSTGGNLRNTNDLWGLETLTAFNRPVFGEQALRLDYATSPLTFTTSQEIEWTGLLRLLPGPMKTGEVGLKLVRPDENSAPYDTAPKFQGTGDANAPYVVFNYEVRNSIPAYAFETPPIIDAIGQRVFVNVSNYVFCLRYGSKDRWTGGFSPARPSGDEWQVGTYQVTRMGFYGARSPATVGAYVRNRTAAALNYNRSALYAVSHYPIGGSFELGISKLGTGNFGGTNNETPYALLATDESNTLVSGTNPIASSAACSFMLIDPFSARAAGGDLLFTLAGTNRIYRVGTE